MPRRFLKSASFILPSSTEPAVDPMRFLLDENVHQKLISFLSNLGHDVILGPKRLSNGDLLNLAIREKRILITHDTDFAATPITVTHTGIILVKIPPRNIDPLKASFERLLARKKSAEEFGCKLVLLFADRSEESPGTFNAVKW